MRQILYSFALGAAHLNSDASCTFDRISGKLPAPNIFYDWDVGCSPTYGPTLVIEYITAPNISGTLGSTHVVAALPKKVFSSPSFCESPC